VALSAEEHLMSPRRAGRPSVRPAPDVGVTLIEIMTTLMIGSILMAASVATFTRYTASREQSGTADDLSSTLRYAGQRAIAEEITFCVHFDLAAGTWRTYRYACSGGAAQVDMSAVRGSRTSLTAAAFLAPTGGTSADVLFTPRGTASDGSVDVIRTGTSTRYRISVEGLTARVTTSR
jgi:Tfp pilus assembly protein FimT